MPYDKKAPNRQRITIWVDKSLPVPRFTPGTSFPPVTFSDATPSYRYVQPQGDKEEKNEKQD